MNSTTLHTLSGSWHNHAWLYEQLAFASKGDTILLIEDGVLAAQSPLTLASFLAKCKNRGVTVALLNDDMLLRGVDNNYSQIDLVDYAGFVELCGLHEKQVAW